jgi:hypothetical protein
VLASGAFDVGILNASFFTTLMVTAVVISGLGFWHGFVLRKGWSLLKAEGPVHNTVSPRPSSPRAITTGSTSGPPTTPSDRT